MNDHLLIRISDWIDDAPQNAARDREAALWGRVSKVSEECGETIAALIGATGQNPRKGTTHVLADVCEELLDVALTALAAWYHITEDREISVAFAGHVERRAARVGLLDGETP